MYLYDNIKSSLLIHVLVIYKDTKKIEFRVFVFSTIHSLNLIQKMD